MGAIGLAKSLAVAAFAELAMLAAGVADVLRRTAGPGLQRMRPASDLRIRGMRP